LPSENFIFYSAQIQPLIYTTDPINWMDFFLADLFRPEISKISLTQEINKIFNLSYLCRITMSHLSPSQQFAPLGHLLKAVED